MRCDQCNATSWALAILDKLGPGDTVSSEFVRKLIQDVETVVEETRSETVPPGIVGHLEWIADRLVEVYGENRNVDFVLKLREYIAALKKV